MEQGFVWTPGVGIDPAALVRIRLHVEMKEPGRLRCPRISQKRVTKLTRAQIADLPPVNPTLPPS